MFASGLESQQCSGLGGGGLINERASQRFMLGLGEHHVFACRGRHQFAARVGHLCRGLHHRRAGEIDGGLDVMVLVGPDLRAQTTY